MPAAPLRRTQGQAQTWPGEPKNTGGSGTEPVAVAAGPAKVTVDVSEAEAVDEKTVRRKDATAIPSSDAASAAAQAAVRAGPAQPTGSAADPARGQAPDVASACRRTARGHASRQTVADARDPAFVANRGDLPDSHLLPAQAAHHDGKARAQTKGATGAGQEARPGHESVEEDSWRRNHAHFGKAKEDRGSSAQL